MNNTPVPEASSSLLVAKLQARRKTQSISRVDIPTPPPTRSLSRTPERRTLTEPGARTSPPSPSPSKLAGGSRSWGRVAGTPHAGAGKRNRSHITSQEASNQASPNSRGTKRLRDHSTPLQQNRSGARLRSPGWSPGRIASDADESDAGDEENRAPWDIDVSPARPWDAMAHSQTHSIPVRAAVQSPAVFASPRQSTPLARQADSSSPGQRGVLSSPRQPQLQAVQTTGHVVDLISPGRLMRPTPQRVQWSDASTSRTRVIGADDPDTSDPNELLSESDYEGVAYQPRSVGARRGSGKAPPSSSQPRSRRTANTTSETRARGGSRRPLRGRTSRSQPLPASTSLSDIRAVAPRRRAASTQLAGTPVRDIAGKKRANLTTVKKPPPLTADQRLSPFVPRPTSPSDDPLLLRPSRRELEARWEAERLLEEEREANDTFAAMQARRNHPSALPSRARGSSLRNEAALAADLDSSMPPSVSDQPGLRLDTTEAEKRDADRSYSPAAVPSRSSAQWGSDVERQADEGEPSYTADTAKAHPTASTAEDFPDLGMYASLDEPVYEDDVGFEYAYLDATGDVPSDSESESHPAALSGNDTTGTPSRVQDSRDDADGIVAQESPSRQGAADLATEVQQRPNVEEACPAQEVPELADETWPDGDDDDGDDDGDDDDDHEVEVDVDVDDEDGDVPNSHSTDLSVEIKEEGAGEVAPPATIEPLPLASGQHFAPSESTATFQETRAYGHSGSPGHFEAVRAGQHYLDQHGTHVSAEDGIPLPAPHSADGHSRASLARDYQSDYDLGSHEDQGEYVHEDENVHESHDEGESHHAGEAFPREASVSGRHSDAASLPSSQSASSDEQSEAEDIVSVPEVEEETGDGRIRPFGAFPHHRHESPVSLRPPADNTSFASETMRSRMHALGKPTPIVEVMSTDAAAAARAAAILSVHHHWIHEGAVVSGLDGEDATFHGDVLGGVSTSEDHGVLPDLLNHAEERLARARPRAIRPCTPPVPPSSNVHLSATPRMPGAWAWSPYVRQSPVRLAPVAAVHSRPPAERSLRALALERPTVFPKKAWRALDRTFARFVDELKTQRLERLPWVDDLEAERETVGTLRRSRVVDAFVQRYGLEESLLRQRWSRADLCRSVGALQRYWFLKLDEEFPGCLTPAEAALAEKPIGRATGWDTSSGGLSLANVEGSMHSQLDRAAGHMHVVHSTPLTGPSRLADRAESRTELTNLTATASPNNGRHPVDTHAAPSRPRLSLANGLETLRSRFSSIFQFGLSSASTDAPNSRGDDVRAQSTGEGSDAALPGDDGVPETFSERLVAPGGFSDTSPRYDVHVYPALPMPGHQRRSSAENLTADHSSGSGLRDDSLPLSDATTEVDASLTRSSSSSLAQEAADAAVLMARRRAIAAQDAHDASSNRGRHVTRQSAQSPSAHNDYTRPTSPQTGGLVGLRTSDHAEARQSTSARQASSFVRPTVLVGLGDESHAAARLKADSLARSRGAEDWVSPLTKRKQQRLSRGHE
ncbi:unnamed protein product [Parajaminaea phylloscopi]